MRRDRFMKNVPTVMLSICILTSATVMVKTVLAGPTQLAENNTRIAQTTRDIARSLGESSKLADVGALRPGTITSDNTLAQAVSEEAADFGVETSGYATDIYDAAVPGGSALDDASAAGSAAGQRPPLPHTGGGTDPGEAGGGTNPGGTGDGSEGGTRTGAQDPLPFRLQPVSLVTNDRDAYLGNDTAEMLLADGMEVDATALALCNEGIPYGHLETGRRFLSFHQTEIVYHGPGMEDAWSMEVELPAKDGEGGDVLIPLTIVIEDSDPYLYFVDSTSGKPNTVDIVIEWGGDVPEGEPLVVETELGPTIVELEGLEETGQVIPMARGALTITPTDKKDEYELMVEGTSSGAEAVVFTVTDTDGDVARDQLVFRTG